MYLLAASISACSGKKSCAIADFLQGEGEYSNGSLTLKTAKSQFPGEKIALNRIKECPS